MKHVCVLSGIHRGAVVEIGDTPVLIGGDDDCDALLSDEAASGSVVQIASRPDGTLRATPMRGVVSRNTRRLRSDKEISFRKGAVIGVGGVDIAAGRDLDMARKAMSERDKRRMMLNWGGFCAACIVAFGLFAAVGGPADAFNSFRTPKVVLPSVEAERIKPDPLAELDRELAKQGLSNRITLKRTGSMQILATGTVDASQFDRWNGLIRWFDGRFGSVTMLDSQVKAKGDGFVLPFQIVSIHSSPNPHVVIQNGQVFSIGTFMPGGWELRDIASMKVVLVRGDQELAISF